MKNFLIVSKADKLEEYKKISEEYGVSYEINDFFWPAILEDEKKVEQKKAELEELLNQYKELAETYNAKIKEMLR